MKIYFKNCHYQNFKTLQWIWINKRIKVTTSEVLRVDNDCLSFPPRKCIRSLIQFSNLHICLVKKEGPNFAECNSVLIGLLHQSVPPWRVVFYFIFFICSQPRMLFIQFRTFNCISNRVESFLFHRYRNWMPVCQMPLPYTWKLSGEQKNK